MSEHTPTPGDWKPGKRPFAWLPPTEVVSDCQCEHLFPCCHKTHGGHLIAQRVNPRDVPLLSAAKKLLAGCEILNRVLQSGPQSISYAEIEQIQAAIAEATQPADHGE